MSADFLHNSFSGCTPFNVGIQELLRLIGGKQLDGQDILQLFGCRASFFAGVVSHSHIVLLVSAGRRVVDGCGGSQNPHLIQQAGLRILRDHQARIKARRLDAEPRISGQAFVNQTVISALRHLGKGSGGNAGAVHFDSHIGGVRIAG